ncbi:1-phosphofructokinase [Allohahella marinimesophila]|uniref:Phosphofructokinase n=1 Tax=Allohahella marinimesophila TaxID=1054972 RepID=A0ABP7NU67_9GAMM
MSEAVSTSAKGTRRPIVTVTLNPALDLTLQVQRLQTGEVNLASQEHLRPAGKGINVALVLRALDQAVCVTGILGLDNRQPFDSLFDELRMENHFSYTTGATRINVKISEQDGRITDVNSPGLKMSEAAMTSLRLQLSALDDVADFFVLSGSLPQGLEPRTYAELTSQLKTRRHRVIVDTSGAALQAVIEAAPFLIKPNVQELSQLAGRELITQQDQEAVIRDLLAQGIEHVVLSDGGRGARWYNRQASLQAIPPEVTVVSTVGAGDSMVAGLSYGLSKQLPLEETFRLATALSAMAVSQIGVGATSPAELKQLQQQVTVKPLPFSF